MASTVVKTIGRVITALAVLGIVSGLVYLHFKWTWRNADGESEEAAQGGFQSAVAERKARVLSNLVINAKAFEILSEDDLVPVKPLISNMVHYSLGYEHDTNLTEQLEANLPATKTKRSEANHRVERTYRVETIAENLLSPDGLAVNPVTRDVYVSEKKPGRIRVLKQGVLSHVVDSGTRIYQTEDRNTPSGLPLRLPEGIAFDKNGDLFVVEDLPGGRLIRFPMQSGGRYTYGVEITVPGEWQSFAWESLSIGPRGDMLLSGSDMNREDSEANELFSGAIVYRDPDGAWWVPYDRLFARFSSVIFSKSGRHAIYACELTGELGWLDLQSRRPLGGISIHVPDTPEGICSLPDGTYLVAERDGRISSIDPATEEREIIIHGLNQIESIIWDGANNRALVSDNKAGRIFAIVSDIPYTDGDDLFDYAIFHPNYAPQNVPDVCPAYLEGIFEMAGIQASDLENTYVSFRDIAARLPMIAAKAVAKPVSEKHKHEDPIKTVQFVIFEPDKLVVEDDTGEASSLAAFVVTRESGVTNKTSMVKLLSREPSWSDYEGAPKRVYLPKASSVAVSTLGIAAIQFSGMGVMPDFSFILNPWNERESYMVVFEPGGGQYYYRLHTPPNTRQRELWVLAYSNTEVKEWPQLAEAKQTDKTGVSADIYRERNATGEGGREQ